MKILTAAQMRAADQATFEQVGVSSLAVMESAGRQVLRFLSEQYAEELQEGAIVLAGGGNNGGDGYVVARGLQNLGVDVVVAAFKPLKELKGDAAAKARAFLSSDGEVLELSESEWNEGDFPDRLRYSGVIVDAIYGTGIQGKVRGFTSEVIEFVNMVSLADSIPIVSVDIPSGVGSDDGAVAGSCIYATATVALQCLKFGHVLFPAAAYCGEVILADIGIARHTAEISEIKTDLITEASVAKELRFSLNIEEESHKGEKGHAVVIGGSPGFFGAPKLSAMAALRMGAGLVTMVLPEQASRVVGPQLTELMCLGLEGSEDGAFAGADSKKIGGLVGKNSCLVIGPGLGQSDGAKQLLDEVLQLAEEEEIPLVVDADALNILAAEPELQELLGPHVVLTPHPGEMARLMGTDSSDVQGSRVEMVSEARENFGCWVVLKGARTITAGPEGEILINPAATPTLATAGSGDVLAGILAALLARGLPLDFAVPAAVFIHGAAGELAEAEVKGLHGVVASDLIDAAPRVTNALVNCEPPRFQTLSAVLPGSLRVSAELLFPGK